MQELPALQDGDISELDFRVSPLNLICYGHQMDLFKRKLKELKLENNKEWECIQVQP